jgi:hypothetical protein
MLIARQLGAGMVLYAAGLQHKRSHRRHPLAELAGDQPQRLTPPPPRPHLILLSC